MFNLSKLAALIGMFSTVNPVPFANRNMAVDGALDQWQATSYTLTTGQAYGGPVMYLASAGTGGAGTLSQTDARTVLYGANSKYLAHFAQTTASTGTPAANSAPCFYQRLEGLGKYSGRSITFQVKLRATAALTIPMIICRANFGSGGTVQSSINLDKAVSWVVNSTKMQVFSVRIDVPSLAGDDYGSNNDDALYVGMWFPTGSTFAVDIAEIQVEFCDPSSSSDTTGAGGAPTAFEYRGEGPELARVQRYYEVGSCNILTYAPATSAFCSVPVYFNARKRVSPAFSLTRTLTANSVSPATSSVNANSASGYVVYWSSTTTGAAQTTDSWVADSRI